MTVLDRFCDQCGEPRIGQFRYCRHCGSDFEGWRGDPAAPKAKPSTGSTAAAQEPDVAQTIASDPEPTRPLVQRRHVPVAEAIAAIVIGAVALLIVYLATAAIQPPA